MTDRVICLRTLGALELRDTAGHPVRALLAQPKRMALLIYLALVTPRAGGFCRRDTLFALFWPEADEERSRLALRQALHFLRRTLGDGVVLTRGDEEVGLSPERISCDAVAFEQAIDSGHLAEAVELYRGDLLTGFFVSDSSPQLDRWLDDERTRLRTRAANAAWTYADTLERQGSGADAARWSRFAVRCAPDDETAFRRLVALLDRLGDRVGALRAYDDFARQLASEFGVEPSAETRALISAVRAREQPRPASALDSTPPAVTAPSLTATGRPDLPPNARKVRYRNAGLAAAAITFLSLFAFMALRSTPAAAKAGTSAVIAVGNIGTADQESASVTHVLRELLATDLARVEGLQVVSHSRLLELLGPSGVAQESPRAIADAVRRSGATERLEGALYRRGSSLRLDIQRVDVRSGVIRGSYTEEGSDAFDLADRVTRDVASAFRREPPSAPLAEMAGPSPTARRLYEEGLRTYYQADWRGAQKLFDAALAEDSTLAMAADYAALNLTWMGSSLSAAADTRALRLAERGTERERLLIRFHHWRGGYAQWAALAESLATRDPSEVEGQLALANVRASAGNFLEAVAPLQRIIALDSASLTAGIPTCRACDALASLTSYYMMADSFPAAERTARDWARLQPRSAAPWLNLHALLSRDGRRDEAIGALRRALEFEPGASDQQFRLAFTAITADDYREADRLLLDRLLYGAPDARRDALWWLVIARRNEGRLRDALTFARRLSASADSSWSYEASLATTQVLFEMGRHREAARLFDSLANAAQSFADRGSGVVARNRAWRLTHSAASWAAAGDTNRLAPLADSIESAAHQSPYGRDWRLPGHVRGLLWVARGQPARAAVELRGAIYSPTEGYTRTNLELGRVLLALGKPREAVAILQPALRGPVDASNLYVTRTEIHELLAHAFEAAGQRDSATAHYRKVAGAWRGADPTFRARAAAAAKKAAMR